MRIKNSILFNSLLKGYEIRYSDMLSYISKDQNWEYSPFNEEKISCREICREKGHTDFWIEGIKSGDTLPLPFLIIENKLKSLPDELQLMEYSELFLQKYLQKFKKVIGDYKHKSRVYAKDIIGSDFMERTKHLQFYILSPIKSEGFIFDVPHPLIKILKSTITKKRKKSEDTSKEEILLTQVPSKISVEWKPKSYYELGVDLEQKIIEKFQTKESYQNDERARICNEELVKDYASLLKNFKTLFDSIGIVDLKMTLEEIYKVKDGDFEDLELHALHSKYRASQCALELNKRFKNKQPEEKNISCGNWKMSKMIPKQIIIKHCYSDLGKSGLFEIIKKIDNDVAIVVQCEKDVLKKALVFNHGETDSEVFIKKYSNWIEDRWGKKKFSLKSKVEGNPPTIYHTYKIEQPYKFYYSKCQVPDAKLENVLEFMIERIIKYHN